MRSRAWVAAMSCRKTGAARRGGVKKCRVFRIQVKPESLKLKLAYDSRLKQAAQVRERRDFVTGPDFFGHACAADSGAALKHDHAQPCACQVRCCDKPVMPAPIIITSTAFDILTLVLSSRRAQSGRAIAFVEWSARFYWLLLRFAMRERAGQPPSGWRY